MRLTLHQWLRFGLALALAFCSAGEALAQNRPVITTQPQGQSLASGSDLTLMVAATGDGPLRYQWRVNTTNYAGATNAALTVPNITFVNGGPYRVIVSNNSGSVTSEVAMVRVDEHLTFRLTELLTTGSRWVEHNNVTGDDRGGIAVSGNYVLVTGDARTGRFAADTLGDAVGLGPRLDALCNNLRDEKVYTLANGTTPINYGLNFTTVNSLIEIDPASGNTTANRIVLSAGVPIAINSMVFSGWDRIVIYGGSRVHNIALPSGRVTDIGPQSSPNRNFSESWASWGIAEYFDNAVHLVYAQDFNNIVRRRAATSQTTVLTSFSSIGETASIGFSASQGRWFFHHEFDSQFTGGSFPQEVLGSAKASFTIDVNYPLIITNPISHSVYIDSNTVMRVAATGGEPLAYQWLLNGLEIAGATSATLPLTNVQPTNAGVYSVRVSNPSGAVTSAGATLTVITQPFISVQPQPRSIFRGSNTTFSVLGDGAPPLSYQWRFNGANLPNATNTSLALTNVQPNQAGMYSVRVSNRFGAATSANAELFVATVIADGSVFQVTSMVTNGARTVNATTITDYGLGSIAASSSNLFFTGAQGTGRFPLDTLNGGVRLPRTFQALVSNLRTETVYSLGDGANPLEEGGVATTLLEVDGNTGQLTGSRIDLSAPINVTDQSGFFDRVGLFSGYDRIVIHNNSHVYNIALPSGVVTDLGFLSTRQHNYSYGWGHWGVAEHVNGIVYLLYMRDFSTIVRTRVPDGLTTTVTQFPNGISSVLSALTVSIPRGRWYFEYPFGGSTFPSFNSTVGFANATFNVDSGPNINYFEWDVIPTVQSANVPFPVRLTARTSSGGIASNFNGVVTLSGHNAATDAPLPILPISISGFSAGVWTGQVSVLQPAQGVYLRADDRNGNVGQSGVFSVSPTNDLVVLLADSPDPVVLGQNLNYTITLTNTGPAVANGVTLSNALPTNVLFVAVVPSQGTCSNAGNIVQCDMGSVPTGVRVEVAVTVTPTVLGSIIAHATVRRAEVDPDPSNNSASQTTLVSNPSVRIGDLVVTEGDSGTNTIDFVVTLSSPSTNTARVNFTTANGTAAAPVDFVTRSGTVIFPPGSTNQIVSVGVRGDLAYETNETFFINLSAPQNVVIADNQGLCTILNDDAPPLISITDVTVNEGNAGTTNAVFRVALSAPNGLAVVVRYSTSNGTARAGTDYVARNGTITFSPGTPFLTQSVTIQVTGDVMAESNEVFFINLTSATNGILARTQGVGAILNDEAGGSFERFGWSDIPSPQPTNTPIPVTLTAQDFYGNLISNFNGTATLRGAIGQPQIHGTLFDDPGHDFSSSGGPFTFGIDFTPSVDITVTHVRHYVGTKMSIWSDQGVVLANQLVTSTPGTWTETPLSTPVVLQANNTYRLSYFTGNEGYYYSTNLPTSFDHGTIGEMFYNVNDTFPTIVLGEFLFLLDLRYTVGAPSLPVAVNPTSVGPFTNGVWTGFVSVLESAASMHLVADDGQGHAGQSSPFDSGVTPSADLALQSSLAPNPAAIGASITATIDVQNLGPASATSVSLSNQLPANATFISATSSQGACSNSSGTVICALGTFTNGASATVSIIFQASTFGFVTNSATVHASETDPNTNNNIAEAATEVRGDLPVFVSGPDDQTASSGDDATFDVTASGAQPITYRWFFNETNLLSATGPTLLVTNVSMFSGGLYSVVASNAFGVATSRLASLVVDSDLIFRILALRTNGFVVIEHENITGDDRGAIAVSSNQVFYTGDSTTVRWNNETLTGGVSLGRQADALVTDLRTETLYSLANGDTEIGFDGGTITSLLELTATGAPTGRRIDLSQSIFAPGFNGGGVFAGYGRIVIYTGTRVFSIALPSGEVTDLGTIPFPFASNTESWAFWGIAEYFNNAVHLLYVDSRTFPRRIINRMTLPSGTITTAATFTNLADMAAITFSTSLSRWFFHYEGTSQFRPTQSGEVIGSAKAVFTTDAGFPAIVRGPASQTNFPGGNLTLSVVARGTAPLSYQWYLNGAPIAGATEESLLLNNISAQDAGAYTVQVSNSAGTILSDPAILTIFTTPIIRAGPFNRTIYPGQTTTFFVTVDGAPPLTYDWRFNGTSIPEPGGTNAILRLTNVAPSQAGLYSVRVSNIYGSATSSNATLTVITNPFITIQPSAQANYIGSNVTFSVTADGAPPLNYEWRFNGTPITGGTNRMLLLTNIQASHAGNYSVVVSNQYGTVTSVDAELIVLSDTDQGTFQITALLTNGVKIVDHNDLTGDDRGGIGVTASHVFVNGDTSNARFSAADLTGGIRVGSALLGDSMVTDLKTETVWFLGNGTNIIRGGTMTTLIEMDANGLPTNRRITLSAPVLLNSGSPGVFSGYGRVVIHNGQRVFSILVPSGIVQDLGLMPSFNHAFTETWAYWGVAEHVNQTVYLVYVEDFQTIVRRRVPDGLLSTVATFGSLSDMASIVVSPSRQRWYFHYEGGAQFGGNSETLGYGDARFLIRSGTGLDHFAWGPIGPVQAVNAPFTVTLTALNVSNQVVTNFSGRVALSGRSVSGGTPATISPTLISNFVNGVWTGQVTVAQATPAMVLLADDQISITETSSVFSVNLLNDLVVIATDSPDPVILGETLTYSILVTNIGPNTATSVVVTNTLATNLVFVSAVASQGSCTNQGNIVRCVLGNIPGAAGATIEVQTLAGSIGNVISSVTAVRGESDPNSANNSANVQTLITHPSITIGDVSVNELNSGTNDVTFTLTLAPASTNTVRVNFATANVTATTAGSTADYVARSGTVTFAPGETTQTVVVRVRGDLMYEPDETFVVNLSGPVNAVLADNQAVGTILNDDAQPLVSITDVAVTEGNSGTNNAVFRVVLSSSSGLPVVITYETSNSTAMAGTDYNFRLGTVTFTAGTPFLTQSLTIQVLGDLQPEFDETFFVNLTSVSNAVISKGQGIGTIRNDDGIGVLDHFEWAFIASPQQPNVPVPVAITARDFVGNLISNFNDTVQLQALIPAIQSTNSIQPTISSNINSTTGGDFTLGYSFIPSNELRVTHVRHHFGTKVSIWNEDGVLLASVPVVSTLGEWRLTALTNELVLQQGVTYRVAAYSPEVGYTWTFEGTNTFPHGTIIESYNRSGDGFPFQNDSARWWLVDLVYKPVTYAPQPVTPSTSAAFSNGAWTGNITIPVTATNLQLEARTGAASGVSNPFDVLVSADANIVVRIRGTNFVHTGSNIVLSVIVTNRGPASASSLFLTNTLPADFTFISAVPSQGSCSNVDSTVICALGALPGRSAATLTLTLRAGATGMVTVASIAHAPEMDPSPGNNSARFNLTVYLDSDSDGIWDDWELANGTDPGNSADAPLDPDGDGHTNLQEFQAGTDPHNAASVKLLTGLTLDNGQVRIGFRGAVGNTYRVERSDNLQTWTVLSEFQLGAPGETELVDTPSVPTRFYRASRVP